MTTAGGMTPADEPGSNDPDTGGARDRPLVVLVGPPGAGKSTVATLLASRWGVTSCDTDDLVEQRAGKPIAEIFLDDGEPTFRALEQSAVEEALSSQRGVVALGGGAVAARATRALLSRHRVVFLDVGLAAAASRVGLGVTRPLLLGNVRSQLKTLLDARRPLYQEVSQLSVPTDDLPAEAVADKVEQHVHP
jgi:shikimate kinase